MDAPSVDQLIQQNKCMGTATQAQFSNLMNGRPDSDTLLGLGDELALVPDIHEYYNLHRHLD